MNFFKLLEPDKTCVLIKDKQVIYESYENSVKPFVKYIHYNGIPDESCILVDKIIGAAIANVALYAGIKTVYAKTISKPALQLLKEHHVAVFYETLVENILRRDRTDLCPMEKKILQASSPKEAYQFLKEIVINENPIHLQQNN